MTLKSGIVRGVTASDTLINTADGWYSATMRVDPNADPRTSAWFRSDTGDMTFSATASKAEMGIGILGQRFGVMAAFRKGSSDGQISGV